MLLGRCFYYMKDGKHLYENIMQKNSIRNNENIRTTLESFPVARIDLDVLRWLGDVDLQLVGPHSVQFAFDHTANDLLAVLLILKSAVVDATQSYPYR